MKRRDGTRGFGILLLAAVIVAALLPSCAHSEAKANAADAQGKPGWTDWPQGKEPAHAAMYTRNELHIDAPPEVVFAWITQATRWPEFYDNASDVKIDSGGPTLSQGTQFTWNTFGHTSKSTVQVFEPPRRIAWDAQGPAVTAFHTWLLIPERGGTLVVTEETRTGASADLLSGKMTKDTEKYHQHWLEGLAKVSAQGAPK